MADSISSDGIPAPRHPSRNPECPVRDWCSARFRCISTVRGYCDRMIVRISSVGRLATDDSHTVRIPSRNSRRIAPHSAQSMLPCCSSVPPEQTRRPIGYSAVSTIGSPLITTNVGSSCADGVPSAVRTVQPSGARAAGRPCAGRAVPLSLARRPPLNPLARTKGGGCARAGAPVNSRLTSSV
jgi:hypothetical protein